MSDAMYPTRLRWDAHSSCGVARHDGVAVELHRWPGLPGLDGLTEIDYVPQQICVVRLGAGPLREMADAERMEALALLQSMSTAARDSLDRCLTLAVVQHYYAKKGTQP